MNPTFAKIHSFGTTKAHNTNKICSTVLWYMSVLCCMSVLYELTSLLADQRLELLLFLLLRVQDVGFKVYSHSLETAFMLWFGSQ